MPYSDPELVSTVQKVIEFVGTFAFAISGIRHAAAKHFDWFGGMVCGIAVAIGGGTIRDMMLGVTPFWMTSASTSSAPPLPNSPSLSSPNTSTALTTHGSLRHLRTGPLYHRRNAKNTRHGPSLLGSHHHGLHHRFSGRCYPRRTA